MREHIGLYRGKRIFGGRWVGGNLSTPNEACPNYYINCVEYLNEYGDFGVVAHEVDPNTIGECTGLKDKNGKLIFEGDILDGGDFNAEDGYGEVCWYDGAWEVATEDFCGTFHENYYGREFEIIGNIHDNKELLKGGEG